MLHYIHGLMTGCFGCPLRVRPVALRPYNLSACKWSVAAYARVTRPLSASRPLCLVSGLALEENRCQLRTY